MAKKDKPWPWSCVCRGGANKGQPAIKTVYPHVVKNVKVVVGNICHPRSVIVPEVHLCSGKRSPVLFLLQTMWTDSL
jgi:hypothetical protein